MDRSLHLGLAMLNLEPLLVATGPDALDISCRDGDLAVVVRPPPGASWMLEYLAADSWRLLAFDGASASAEVSRVGEDWTVVADPAELMAGGASPVTVRLTVVDAGGRGRFVVERAVGCDAPGGPVARALVWEGEPWPNPFNPTVHARFRLAEAARVRVGVFDLAGRQVKELVSGHVGAGSHSVSWDGTTATGPAGAGVYFLRIDTPDRVLSRKIMLLK